MLPVLVVVPAPPRRRRSPCHVVLSWRHEDHRQPCLPVGVCEHQLLDAWCAALITVLIFVVVAAIVAAIIAIVVAASAVLLLLCSAPNQHACQIPLQFPERVALIQLPRSKLLWEIRVQAAGVLRGTVLLLRCRRCVLHKPLAEQPRDRRRRPEPHWFCHNTGTR